MKPQCIPNVLLPKRCGVAANDDVFGRGMVAMLPSPAIPGILVRLPERTPPDAEDNSRVSALDAMTTIEDLWLRLAAQGVLQLQNDGQDHVTVYIAGAESCEVSPLESRGLAAAVTCGSTYRWCEGTHTGSWVERIEQGGETGAALIHLTAWNSILRWPGGDALVWTLLTVVQRLRLRSQP